MFTPPLDLDMLNKLPVLVQQFAQAQMQMAADVHALLEMQSAQAPVKEKDFHTESYLLLTGAFGRSTLQRLKIVKITVSLAATGAWALFAGEGHLIRSGLGLANTTLEYHFPVVDGAPLDVARDLRLYFISTDGGLCWIDALAE